MFNIEAITLPDQAMRNVFNRLSLEDSHTVFQKYEETRDIFTEIKGIIKYKDDRPILMVSSTSWTPDEDFNMLLDSFIKLEKDLGEEINKLRKVLFLITGKGPQKEAFMKRVNNTKLTLNRYG
jgi:beta-1,4-mannosyltransferase